LHDHAAEERREEKRYIEGSLKQWMGMQCPIILSTEAHGKGRIPWRRSNPYGINE